MFHKSKHKNSSQVILLALTMTGIVLLSIAVGTIAWLRYSRSLQAMTKIHYTSINLEESTSGGFPVQLGEVDVRQVGSKQIPFAVRSKADTQYLLQLGYTKNLPLTYNIYHVNEWNGSIEGASPIEGSVKTVEKNKTYADNDDVHQAAVPEYWQSTPGKCICGEAGLDYYVLKVSWEAHPTDVIDKETEMIYLTAGLGGDITDEPF